MGVNCTKDDVDVIVSSSTAVATEFLHSSPVLPRVNLQLSIPTAITLCSGSDDPATVAISSEVERNELASPGCSGTPTTCGRDRKRRTPKPNSASQRNLINGGGIQSPLPGCTFRTVLDFSDALPLTDREAAASANPLAYTRAHAARQQRQSASASSGTEMALERGDDDEDDGLIDMSLKSEDEDTLLASRASSVVSTASRVSRRSEGDRSVTFESHVIRLGSLSPLRNNSSSSGSFQAALSNGSTRATARRQRHHLSCVVTNNATLVARAAPIEASSTAPLALPIPSDLQSCNASMSLLADSLHMSAQGASSYRAVDMLHVLGGSACLVPM
jgi:hypothetical protein